MFLPIVYKYLKSNGKTNNYLKALVSGYNCIIQNISIGCSSRFSCVDRPAEETQKIFNLLIIRIAAAIESKTTRSCQMSQGTF